ncbi:MAG: DNA recombination protein RmuC [Nanoarchaeota archaeon]|nr:DNA recombination protein RmuC [Nanoarchaeota archaeon]
MITGMIIGLAIGILATLGIVYLVKRTYKSDDTSSSDVLKGIGELKESVNQASTQMRHSHDFMTGIFASSAKRGAVGEVKLSSVLSDILPKKSFCKHTFKDGSQIDQAVKFNGKIVAVDSKFPLSSFQKFKEAKEENEKERLWKLFQKDVKNHIKSITRKYIRPNEGTLPYALMFIPSVAIRDSVIDDDELQAYARENSVVFSCPNDLGYQLAMACHYIDVEEFSKNAEKIMGNIRGLEGSFNDLHEDYKVLRSHVKNAFNKTSDTDNSFGEFQRNITELTNTDEKPKLNVDGEQNAIQEA